MELCFLHTLPDNESARQLKDTLEQFQLHRQLSTWHSFDHTIHYKTVKFRNSTNPLRSY